MDLLVETLARLEILHKENDLPWAVLSRVGLMPKWTAVIGTEGQSGITLNFTEHPHVFGEPRVDIDRLQSFIGIDLFTVAKHYAKSTSLQERSIGASVVSALSQPLLTKESLVNRGYDVLDNSTNFADLVEIDDIVAMVGYGGYALNKVPEKCREFHVTDIRPKQDFQTAIIDSEIRYVPDNIIVHTAEENPSVLSSATAILITGASLVNGTLGNLLKHTGKARLVGVWGPSASVIPDILFERGVNYLETYQMSDPDAFEADVLNNNWDLKNILPKTQKALVIAKQVKP